MNTAWLLEAAIRTLIMAAITLTALKALRIEHIRTRRTAWLLGLGGALLMPLLVAAHLGPRILPDFTPTEPARFSAESGLAVADTVPARARELTAGAPRSRVVAAEIAAAGAPLRQDIVRLVSNIYFIVAASLLLRLSVGLGIALQLKWRARRIDLHAAPKADVRISAQLMNPVTVTSSILLPRNYLQWDAATLRIVLSHEFAHVCQRDFYVQLLAGLHCALFWFNPFSWWLQRQLADLGEALSDHAASQQADSRASYAEVLLRFANSANPPLAAVAMARASNLAPRIERLLNDQGFERFFSDRPRLPIMAAGVVMLALLASTSVKRVDAAPSDAIVAPPAAETSQPSEVAPVPEAPPAPEAPTPAPKPAPAKPARPIPPLIASAPVLRIASIAPLAPPPAESVAPPGKHGTSTWTEIDNGGLSYMNIDNDEVFVFKSGESRDMFNGDFKKRFGRDMPDPQGDFIFYQHQGKPYLVQDPAILSKAQELLAPLKDTRQRQADVRRARTDLAMHRRVVIDDRGGAKLSAPEFKEAVLEVSKQLEQLKGDGLALSNNQSTLEELQNKLGSIQGQLGELQGRLAMQNSAGRMQEAMAEEQNEITREHERLGGLNQKIINDAQRQLTPLIEQAIKDGRAVPVN